MFEEDFKSRLIELRTQKGVSARDMSLSIGQNAGYINNIESGKALPSMSAFFFICDYLRITPAEFFNISVKQPDKFRKTMSQLSSMDNGTFDDIAAVIDRLSKN